uniref:Uncharacterized protein MANES_15G139000 n=1 Tax=Rhizophora mucronata TaxID=61149 RepID=A0A2P2N105_RHIMU
MFNNFSLWLIQPSLT